MANDLVTQARALLAAATPGPWRHDTDDTSYVRVGYRTVCGANLSHHDARLIAAAPTLLAALADRVEQLELAAREVLAAYDAIYAGGHGDGRATRHQDALAALRKAVG